MESRRSFALVMTLCLLVLLATTGAALCVTGAVEATACAAMAASFEHELAVRSMVLCLPSLRRHLIQPSEQEDRTTEERYAVTIGLCDVKCRLRSERGKVQLRSAPPSTETEQMLRRLANDNGLPAEHVRLQPTSPEPIRKELGSFAWFDQVVRTSELGEVFRWRSPEPSSDRGTSRKTWSDLVTFWSSSGAEVLSLEIETRIGNGTRSWYVIVELGSSGPKILHWSPAT